jgi:hypothetical protein
MVFCFVQKFFFSDNTRVRILFFLSRKVRNFFPAFNIKLYDKNSESDFFIFPPPKSEYFFQHRESEYFFRKKPYPPPLQVKWSFPKMFVNLEVYHLFHHFWNKVIHLCKNFVSSLFLFCTLGIVVNIVADKVSFGSAGDMFQNRNIEGMCNLFSTIHHNHQEICFRTAILKVCVICSLLYTIITRRYVLEQQY